MAREEEGFFDDLARGLADGSLTRGKALRLMGAALVGGTLGSLGIREAAADRPGCKREGKNCTRTDQCCSNLVCLSGTCQTPATSTTETPTTTTTPPCPPLPACTDTCPCPSGQTCLNGACCVMLSNGTCAKPCTCDPFCTGEECAGGCICFFRDIDQQSFCGFEIPLEGCGTDDGCAPGQFCDGHACIGAC
jgi:hypothetical protein